MWRRFVGLKSSLILGLLLALVLMGLPGCGGKEPAKETVKEPAAVEETVEPPPPEPADAKGKISRISDIHFNPFYDSTLVPQLLKAEADQWESIFATSQVKGYGTYGGDGETNYNLLDASLKSMASDPVKPAFIVFTGDFIAHDFHERYQKANMGGLDGLDGFILKTFTFMVAMFNKYFDGIPVYISLGNNDSFGGDYAIIPEGAFLKKTTPLFMDKFLVNPDNRASFSATYLVGGYYTLVPPGTENARIISLNTIFFSVKYDLEGKPYDPAEQELEWFEKQLSAAKEKNEKVWLLLHIPPGTNVYSSVHKKQYKSFWKPAYNEKFLQLVTAYAGVIKAGFAGHTHMDDFRVVFDRKGPQAPAVSFIRICPAVSPQFGNNPGFLHMAYDPTAFMLLDYDVFYTDVAKPDDLAWNKEYNFYETYKQPAVNTAALEALFDGIGSDPGIRTIYMNYYDVNHRVELTPENWKTQWCGIGNLTQESWENCAKKDNQ